MLNPLSIQYGQKISGKKINDWCKNQIENNGSHQKYAKFFLSKNYNDNCLYKKARKDNTCGWNKDSFQIVFYKVS